MPGPSILSAYQTSLNRFGQNFEPGLVTGRVCVSGGVFIAEPKPDAATAITTRVTLPDDTVVTFVT
jgi:hypothetical protein